MLTCHKKNNSHEKISPFRVFSSCMLNFALIGSVCLLTSAPVHALVAVADTGNSYPGVGYGAQVLDIILEAWENPDPTVTGSTSITLRIAKDGRPFSCESRRFSSSRLSDTSICSTVAKIGTFPAPPANQNSEITLTFVHDKKNMTGDQNTNMATNDMGANLNIQNTTTPMSNNSSLPVINSNTLATPVANQATPVPSQAQMPSSNASNAMTQKAGEKESSQNQATVTNNQPNIPNVPVQGKILNNPSIPVKTTPPVEENIQISRAEAFAPPSADLVLPAEAMQKYSQDIFNKALPLIRIPAIPSGVYKSTVRIDINPEGSLKSSSIQESSGRNELDNEILRVLRNEIKYPPTPYRDHQSTWLTFTIRK